MNYQLVKYSVKSEWDSECVPMGGGGGNGRPGSNNNKQRTHAHYLTQLFSSYTILLHTLNKYSTSTFF